MVSDINVTPLVDVMLVLLIIFMVAAPMAAEGVHVELPKADTQSVDTEEGKLILTIPIGFPQDKLVYLGKNGIPFPELLVRLSTNEKLKSEREIYIHADGKLNYQAVIDVMAVATKAGADKIGLITDPLSNQ